MAETPNFLFDASDNPTRGTSSGWESVWPPSYNSKYPYNTVRSTQSGHLFEMDDTPGAERVHLFHRSGSRIELRPDGSVQYISGKSRQDVTLGDNLISVHGDYNLTIGGQGRIRVSGGDLILECPEGMAINAKGAELKIDAKNIQMTADGKISLAAPSVDIGGGGPSKNMPFLQIPFGVVNIFGVLVPRYSFFGPSSPSISLATTSVLTGTAAGARTSTNLSTGTATETEAGITPRIALGISDDIQGLGMDQIPETQPTPAPSPSPSPSPTPPPGGSGTQPDIPPGTSTDTGNIGLGEIAAGLLALASALRSLLQQVNDIKSYTRSVGRGVSLLKTLTDAAGNKIIPEIKQPEIIPLKSPQTYYGSSAQKIAFRDRQFDTPEDVNDTTRYTAHLSICEKLGDFTSEMKNLPGQLEESDNELPSQEPRPYWPFAISGTAYCQTDSNELYGTGTQFTDELEVGQTLRINNKFVQIAAIADDATLILSAPWVGQSVTGASMVVYRLRRFSDYAGIFEYKRDVPLGVSGLILNDFLRNFIAPIVEKETKPPGAVDDKIPNLPITPPPPTSYVPPVIRVLPRRFRVEAVQISVSNYSVQTEIGEPPAVYGYFITSAPSHVLTFATGTIATSTINFVLERSAGFAGITDASTYGYISGGDGAPTTTNGTERLTYATQTLATYTVGNLTQVRGDTTGLSDKNIYGYVAGGSTGTVVASAERITFASGVYSAHTASLSQSRFDLIGLSDGENYGYFSGGLNGATRYATTDRVTFSSGAIAAHTPSNLSTALDDVAAISDNSTYGYFAGGSPQAETQYLDRITFSTGINQATTTSLPYERSGLMTVTDGQTYGYLVGGIDNTIFPPSNPTRTEGMRLTFATGVLGADNSVDLTSAHAYYQGISDLAV